MRITAKSSSIARYAVAPLWGGLWLLRGATPFHGRTSHFFFMAQIKKGVSG
jgi:hypothetical protein